MNSEMTLEQAIALAKSGQAVLFLGAGFSISAKNNLGKSLPLAHELKKSMADLAGCEEHLPLEDIAEYFLQTQSARDYLTFLESNLRCVEASTSNLEIAKLPWMRVYTTNFDDVYEFSSRKVGVDCKSINISQGLQNSTLTLRQAVHINGSIDNLSLETIGQIRLTHSSYAVKSFLDNPWVEVFRSDLATARAVVFLGYSLVDIDIRRLLSNNNSLSRKLHIIVRNGENGPSIGTLQEYGHVYPIGVEAFADLVTKSPDVGSPKPETLVFGSFENAAAFRTKGVGLTDRDAFALFCYGTIDPSHIWSCQRKVSEKPLLVSRAGFDKAVEALTSNNDVVIHGHLSTGKSLLLEQMYFNEYDPSWHIFRLLGTKYRWREEVRAICGLKGRVVVLIDNYPQHREVVDEFALHRNKKLSLVLTARTNDFDVTLRDIEEKLRDYVDIDINFLTPSEANELAQVFDKYGFLAQLAGTSPISAVKRLRDQTRLQLHSILLWLFNSEAVKRSVLAEISLVFDNDSAKHFLVNGLVLSLLGLEPDTDFIFDFDADLRGRFNSEAKNLVSPFSERETGAFQARSSVLARYVLNEVLDPNELLEIIKNICRVSVEKSKFGFANQQFWQLPAELSKFANQIALFPSDASRGCIIEFYEFAKNFERLKSHVHFWLQYSIARTSMDHFDEADQLFATTYELAKRQGRAYNTNFIDNHYARFLILRATKYPFSVELAGDVRKAMDLLQAQMKSEDDNKHYPFKVATLLIDFAERHYQLLADVDLERLEAFAKDALRRIPQLKGHVREHFSVREFEKKFKEFLSLD
jgi:hypothetical protein